MKQQQPQQRRPQYTEPQPQDESHYLRNGLLAGGALAAYRSPFAREKFDGWLADKSLATQSYVRGIGELPGISHANAGMDAIWKELGGIKAKGERAVQADAMFKGPYTWAGSDNASAKRAALFGTEKTSPVLDWKIPSQGSLSLAKNLSPDNDIKAFKKLGEELGGKKGNLLDHTLLHDVEKKAIDAYATGTKVPMTADDTALLKRYISLIKHGHGVKADNHLSEKVITSLADRFVRFLK